MTLNLGSKLNPEDVKEGDDVYFECDVKANPHVNKIMWYHEVGATPLQIHLKQMGLRSFVFLLRLNILPTLHAYNRVKLIISRMLSD